MENYTVSVAVLTYNPNREKLLSTIKSILQQKNIRLQIIVADDGSAEPQLQAVQELFEQYQFTDYILVPNQTNRGTVYNIQSALSHATGTYFKAISPGDMLSNNTVLSRWVDAMEADGAAVSCSDVIYYITQDNTITPVSRYRYPQYTNCYLQHKTAQARYNYLILDDIFLGAAIICRTDLQKKYVDEIAGKVVYAEDNIYRLMAYDRIPMHFYPEYCVLYETSTGISTSGNTFWRQKLQQDWDATNQMLLQRCSGKDPIDKQLKKLLTLPKNGIGPKLIKYLTIPRQMEHWVRRKFFSKKSQIRLSDKNEVILWK